MTEATMKLVFLSIFVLLTFIRGAVLLDHESSTAAANKINADLPDRASSIKKIPAGSKRSTELFCTIDGLFCVPANYSKYVPPLDPAKKPMEIAIGFDNFEILKIDDRDFTVEINAYLIVKWKDPRVIIDFYQLAGVNETMPESGEWIPVELELVDKIWLPDTEILRLKGFNGLEVLGRLQGLWMSISYEVLYVLATRIRFMCPMNFNRFPMDEQTCKFQVGSFNYDNTKMVYSTYFLPTLPNSTDPILDYDVKVTPLDWSERYYLPQETGNYSVAGFKLNMERKMTHYIITYYLPSGLFVVVSWASFLIPSDDIQGRMALLVTLFLVLVNIFNAITTNSPKADGLNALQGWVLTCIFFVFGALLEYSLILLHLKIYSLSLALPGTTSSLLQAQFMAHAASAPGSGNGSTPFPQQIPTHRPGEAVSVYNEKMMRQNRIVSRFDLVCLVVFPIIYVLFVFIYILAVTF